MADGQKDFNRPASLMNKMLEFVEAQKIFEINPNKIEIVLHPQSLYMPLLNLKMAYLNFFIIKQRCIYHWLMQFLIRKMILKNF